MNVIWVMCVSAVLDQTRSAEQHALTLLEVTDALVETVTNWKDHRLVLVSSTLPKRMFEFTRNPRGLHLSCKKQMVIFFFSFFNDSVDLFLLVFWNYFATEVNVRTIVDYEPQGQ